jgi:DNA-binding NarL/FixJ family response regulator
MHPSRVLLADDHPALAAAIGDYVAEAFQLVGTVRDGGAWLEAAPTLTPDVIVADISRSGTHGSDRDEAEPDAPAARENDPVDQ